MIYLNKTSNNDEDKSKNIYLSKLYRLPVLLRNENSNSVKFNSINKIKISRTKTEESNRENSTKNSKHKIKQIPPLDSSIIQKSIEYKTKLTEEKNNKNINIHFINYNKISLIKKELGPIKITERINDSGYKRKENSNSVKFNSINKIKISKAKTEESNRENSTKNSNHKIKQIPPLDSSIIQKSIEYKTKLTDEKNKKNINIHFINYNKISLIKKELGPIKITERINDSGYKRKENKAGFSALENCLKDKFYVDTEARLKKKINDQDFTIDHSLKDKIIEMNKIGDFWGGILNYCNPIFTIKRYKYITDELRKYKDKNNNNNNYGVVNELKKKDKNISELKRNARPIKSSNLYTLNSLSSSKHRNKLKIKKEFLEKYNDFQQYYLH